MAVVFYTPDGHGHCIFSEKDRRDILQEYAGEDFARWVDQLHAGFNRKKAQYESDYKIYESAVDSNNACFQELVNCCDCILQHLDRSRINKIEVRRLVHKMITDIKNQI